MKTKIFLILIMGFVVLKAQSIIIIGNGAVLNVSIGAYLCSDSLAGTVTGDGSFCGNPTNLEIEQNDITPTEFALYQNYPNPFNPTTRIVWQSPVSANQILKVYDALGNQVAILAEQYKPAGTYEVEFDATKLSSGVYLYKLQIGSFITSRKMILIK